MPIASAVPAIIGAGSSIVGGILGSNAASKAAQQQQQALQQGINTTSSAVTGGQAGVASATGNANDILSRAAQTELGMYAPYVQAGQSSLSGIEQAVNSGPLTQQFSFNPSDLQNDPGYQFTLQQGQQAIQRAAAAQGNLFSSGTLKSLAGYTTGSANQYFNDAYNRALGTFQANQSQAMNRIGTLQGLAGLGYGATSQGAGAVGSTSAQQAGNTYGAGTFNAGLGLQGAQNISSLLAGQGNAAAAGTIGSANAWSGALGGATNAINSFLTQRNAVNGGGLNLSTLANLPQTGASNLSPFQFSDFGGNAVASSNPAAYGAF